MREEILLRREPPGGTADAFGAPASPRGGSRGAQHQARGLEGRNDARTGMPAGIPAGAMCVQRLDDSLNSAIHISYRISLRSSSMPQPRDPLLKVLIVCLLYSEETLGKIIEFGCRRRAGPPGGVSPAEATTVVRFTVGLERETLGNDPSAGSPTETLLRLLLPLNDRVWTAFRP
jgi:hypothetical protein